MEKELQTIEQTAVQPVVSVVTRDPEKELAFGQKCATALMGVINKKPKKVIINGEQYLEFEDWQTIARFFNLTVGTDWTKRLENGYEARAVVYDQNGTVIGSAESSCLRDEPKWNTRKTKNGDELVPEFQLRSMAQTRACAKALRNCLAWVAVLAGYKPTPAEEMDGVISGEVIPQRSEQVEQSSNAKVCPLCNKKHFGRYPKCLDCWKAERDGTTQRASVGSLGIEAPGGYSATIKPTKVVDDYYSSYPKASIS